MKKIIIIILAAAIILVNGGGYYLYGKEAQTYQGTNTSIVESTEQQEILEHPAFAIEEYESVLPEGTNIALDGKIKSDGFEGTYTDRKAMDGNTGGASYWEGAADLYPNNLTVTFEETHVIHAVRVALNSDTVWGKRTQTFSVRGSDENGEEVELVPETAYDFDPNRGNEVILSLEDTTVSAVTLCFTGNTGASGAQVAEFEIYE